jgi:hypothetical protein
VVAGIDEKLDGRKASGLDVELSTVSETSQN